MDQLSQNPFDAVTAETNPADRQQVRDSLFLTADFRVADSQVVRQVRVRNLSSGGLMAELPEGMAQGVRVDVGVRGIGWIAGQVAWSAAGRVGVAFDHPIDPMLARKPVGQGGQTPVYAKPAPTIGKLR